MNCLPYNIGHTWHRLKTNNTKKHKTTDTKKKKKEKKKADDCIRNILTILQLINQSSV
jgi:hypothetical protein